MKTHTGEIPSLCTNEFLPFYIKIKINILSKNQGGPHRILMSTPSNIISISINNLLCKYGGFITCARFYVFPSHILYTITYVLQHI